MRNLDHGRFNLSLFLSLSIIFLFYSFYLFLSLSIIFLSYSFYLFLSYSFIFLSYSFISFSLILLSLYLLFFYLFLSLSVSIIFLFYSLSISLYLPIGRFASSSFSLSTGRLLHSVSFSLHSLVDSFSSSSSVFYWSISFVLSHSLCYLLSFLSSGKDECIYIDDEEAKNHISLLPLSKPSSHQLVQFEEKSKFS